MSARGRAGGDGADLRPERLRFTRERGHHGPSLAERLAEQLDRLSFQSPLHRLRLKGRFPLKLLAVPQDPVPGDPKSGARLRAGRLYHAGFGQPISEARIDDPSAPPEWRRWVHGWVWLRDAAAAGIEGKSELARLEMLARRWLATYPDYHAEAWAPELTGQRILLAVAHAPLILSSHDHVHRSATLNAVARWTRHLERAAPRTPPGLAQARAFAGLVGGHLILPGNEGRIDRAIAAFDAALAPLIGAAGETPSRCPLDLAELGDLLLFVEAFHGARGQSLGEPLAARLAAVRAGLTALAEGDGVPAPWHGGQPSSAQVARLGAGFDARAIPTSASGFRRLLAGETVVTVDAGAPPPARVNCRPHASTLAITMSDGAEPLLVSCGGACGAGAEGAARRDLPAELMEGLRTTAAHSALVLSDTNSTRVTGSGPRRLGGVSEVVVELRASAEGQWLEASHDGYRRRFGLDHVRRLWLSPDGADFRGEDLLVVHRRGIRLVSTAWVPVAVRFHLAPGSEAVLTQDEQGVFVRTRAGGAWSFRASFPTRPGRVVIEPSVQVSAHGEVREIQQILLETETGPDDETRIGWSFRRGGSPRPSRSRNRRRTA
jgi:uncharacterized heparinase superfamily protein